MRDARDKAVKKEEGRTIIYHRFVFLILNLYNFDAISVGQDWRPFGNPKKIRPFKSVVLSDGVADQIKSDVQDFLRLDISFVSFFSYIFSVLTNGTSIVEFPIGEVIFSMVLL